MRKARKTETVRTVIKYRTIKVWTTISSVMLGFLIALTLVARCVPFCYNGMNSLFGGERRVLVSGDPSQYMRFKPDYASKKEVLAAANALNEEICEEGIILLKNVDGILPLLSAKKITVFGKNSVDPVIGGSGSSSAVVSATGLYSALVSAGFEYNTVLKSFYESPASGSGRPSSPSYGSVLTGFPVAETPLSDYTASIRSSYSAFNDAALVFISRIGGEGYDLPRTMFWDGSNYTAWSAKHTVPGARSHDAHYLQLDQNETDMVGEACANFDSVIFIVNSSSPIELGFLDDPGHYAYNAKLKAALWIGNPGGTGLNALGKILNGSANPSGKTVDTFARDFKKDPTWNNFGNNLKADGNRYTWNDKAQNAYFVEYKEGIYVGYRYYETRAFTEEQKGDPEWYSKNVVFPFGYGLSYSKFKWEVVPGTSLAQDTELSADDTIAVDVKVTNIGPLPGKEVVQLYYTAEYRDGGIEKASTVLGDFKKTRELMVGEDHTVTLKLKVRDMASYDYSDANMNGFSGYEVEAGDYEIKIMSDSHTEVESISCHVVDDIKYRTDPATGTRIENLFDDVSGHIDTYLSRSDWEGSWPEKPDKADCAVSRAFIESLNYIINDKPDDPWYAAVMPDQSKKAIPYGKTIKLYELVEKSYGDDLWDSFMNQLTVAQMAELISVGHFRTAQIINIDKPLTNDADGPTGYVAYVNDPKIYDTCYYASGCVLAATRNAELAEKYGIMIGNEGIIGNEKGDGRPYSGWYAPAMNIHRSQFGGRNFEYYSEDGRLSGIIAQAVVKGAGSKGIYTYCKHFALNEQETNRDTNGILTWANEQSMRELYFTPFEMSVKNGPTMAMMTSFNRIGTVWAGGHYNLLTRMLRKEWGFEGMVISDYNQSRFMSADQMIRAGGDLSLSIRKPLSSVATATDITALRRAAKNILYTVAKSNAMNGMGDGVVYSYAMPYWLIGFIIANAALITICAGWGVLAVLKAAKKNRAAQNP